MSKMTATDPPLGRPIGISREERDRGLPGQSEDSRGPSVLDRGSDEIDARWAKETIGLVAVELNQAYAEFEFTRNDGSIPSGRLQKAHRMLLEAMMRLGVSSVYCNNDNPF